MWYASYTPVDYITPQAKLELITGIPVQNQRIFIENNDGHTIRELADDAHQLGFYELADFQTLKVCFFISLSHCELTHLFHQVVDTNPSMSFTGQLSDVSQVEKFELSDDAYAKRAGQCVHLRRVSTS